MNNELNIDKLVKAYFVAKKFVIDKGYADEIDWQDSIDFSKVDSQYFMQEYSWVVLSSGMSAKVIAQIFPTIKEIFKNWADLEYIVKNRKSLLNRSLLIFNHKQKLSAIINTSEFLYKKGFPYIKRKITPKDIEYLKNFPFIGETTCFHLAKNLGLTFTKPDRHLVRISQGVGFKSPSELCKFLSTIIYEKVQVIDLVLWRYATLDNNYLSKIKKLVAN